MSDFTWTEPVQRIGKEITKSAALINVNEARYLVTAYYTLQGERIAMGNRIFALEKDSKEQNLALGYFMNQFETLERQMKGALAEYASSTVPGRWMQSIQGIGPVIAAGLMAHIDIEKAPTVGHIWRFAGLDSTVTWDRGEKRPWNAALKVITWKIGESFVKVSNSEDDFYGKVYAERKLYEIARNEKGELAEQAAAMAKKYPTHKQIKFYKAGLLPDGHIHSRAKRYAVKLFLSHVHHVMYQDRFGTPPPKPYIIEHGGHAHFIAPPNWGVEAKMEPRARRAKAA
jgi:hypothetical protein